MPPFEGFDPTNLRQTASLYDNLLDEVQTYSSELKERFHITVQSNREDVVAKRDIIVGQHPLYEPGTAEWDEFVVGKSNSFNAFSTPDKSVSGNSEKEEASAKTCPTFAQEPNAKSAERPKRKSPPQSCTNAQDVLEWVEIFTGLCVAPKQATRECGRCSSYAQTPEPTEEFPCNMSTSSRSREDKKSEPAAIGPPKPDIAALKNKVLYPIAKYPSRLDSQRLVEQRRRFLENRVNFKPLRLEKHKSLATKSL